jgi:PadR family transcriptional regulator AphA
MRYVSFRYMAARARSTPYAVLGMLSLAPMSGYDIRKESEQSIGYFWSESYGQIYPALRDLKAEGLIRRRPGKSNGNRDRQVYEITERGRAALAAWRAEPPRETPYRNELLLKLFFGRTDTVAQEPGWIERLLAEETAALREFERIKEQIEKEQHDHVSRPFWLMALSYGEHHSRAILRWGRETQKALRALEREAEKRGTK